MGNTKSKPKKTKTIENEISEDVYKNENELNKNDNNENIINNQNQQTTNQLNLNINTENNEQLINNTNRFLINNGEEGKQQERIETNDNEEFDENKNDNDIKKIKNKEKGIIIKPSPESLIMEVTQQKANSRFRKFKFNGITVVQDLKDYFPKDITKEELSEIILEAFGDGIVEDIQYYIPGKTITKEQANEIIDLVLEYIINDEKVEDLNKDNVLPGVNLTIDLVDLDKDVIRSKMFKGHEVSEMKLENVMKNLNSGLNNVKLLSIEFNE